MIFQDQCGYSDAVSIEDVFSFGTLKNFLIHSDKYSKYMRDTASKVILGTKSKRTISIIKELKKVPSINLEVYFITPLGLLYEADLLIPYRECIDSLSSEKLGYLFKETGLEDSLIDLLNRVDVDIFILNMKHRTMKLLNIEENIHSKSLYIIITERPYRVDKENVIILYPSDYFINKLRKGHGKASKETFLQNVLEAIQRFLVKLSTLDKNAIKKVLREISSFDDIIDFIKTIERNGTLIEKVKEMHKPQVEIVEVPKLIVRGDYLPKFSELFQIDEILIDSSALEVSKRLKKFGIRHKILLVHSLNNVKLDFNAFDEVEIIRSNGCLNCEIEIGKRKKIGYRHCTLFLDSESEIIIAFHPIIVEAKPGKKVFLATDEKNLDIDNLLRLNFYGLILFAGERIDLAKMNPLLEKFKIVVVISESNNVKVFLDSGKLVELASNTPATKWDWLSIIIKILVSAGEKDISRSFEHFSSIINNKLDLENSFDLKILDSDNKYGC